MEEEIPIVIRFFSTLRNAANVDRISKTIPKGTPLIDIILDVEKEYFTPHNVRIIDPSTKRLETGIICLINDADISLTGGLNQKITKPNKVITLISSLHGG